MAVTDALCRSFLDLWWHFDPAAATRAGVTDYDTRLGAFDADSLREHLAAFRSLAGAVEELEVERTADEIDRTALLDHLRVLLYWLEQERPHRRNPALWLLHLSDALEGLLTRKDAAAGSALLERLRAFPRFLKAARAAWRQPPGFLVATAQAQLGPLSALLDAAAERFADGWGAVQQEAPEVLTEARTALEQLELALPELALDPDPHAAAIGEAEVDRRLHYEHASIHNAPEAWRGALRLAAEVEGQVTELANALEPGKPWRDVYQRRRGAGMAGPDLLAAFREALQSVERFAAAHDLGGPAPELGVELLSPGRLLFEPAAAYRPAGATARAAVELGAPDPVALPWLAARLGLPGLHLATARRETQPGLVRRHIVASSTPLGWSLVAAELLVELGFLPDPETRLAERVMLLAEVQLALADLGLHTRQFTPDEAVAHLLEHLPLERAAALAHIRRLACYPTSACAAILGRDELRRLRADAARERGSSFDLTAFHAELLGYGGLPVPLIRWGMGFGG